jgi:phosphatidylserine decarboxylase
MVHISLPHRISGLSKSKSKESNQSGTATPEHGSRRPSPSRAFSTSTMGEKPLVLKVYVIKARQLAAKDRSGTSDPYLTVMLGNARQSTPSISKTLNPEWKICFDMPITDVPLLECVCWDKDRFKKDYMGEFDIPVEDIFSNGSISTEPRWFKLKSKRKEGKRRAEVSGEVQMSFSLVDSANPSASPEEIQKRFRSVLKLVDEDDDLSRTSTNVDEDDIDDDEDDDDLESSTTEADTPSKPGAASKKEKKKRLARLRRKSIAVRAYDFVGGDGDISGMVFMEIVKVTDLPPERNMTRTSFDMDPFVVTAFGRKVLRTKVVRHNLNPVYNEKMIFQVMKHETGYSLTFTVIDKDNLSGNDFVASSSFPIGKFIDSAPELDPDTGLFNLPEPPEYSPQAQKQQKSSRFRLPLSRTSSASSVTKLGRPSNKREESALSVNNGGYGDSSKLPPSGTQTPTSNPAPTSAPAENGTNGNGIEDSEGLETFELPLELKNKERWEAKHSPVLQIKGKYLPYTALRQQFWRAMLKQYDADESRRISKIELSTMLDTLGSTLRESTIDGFFARFAGENEDIGEADLTFDQAVICLEDQLEKSGKQKKTLADRAKDMLTTAGGDTAQKSGSRPETGSHAASNTDPNSTAVPALKVDDLGEEGETGEMLGNDLSDENTEAEEHVIEIRECPICHQPKLNKRSDAEIITHIATCASADWRQVNNLVMGGFVTQSQAQRKWYSKVITKISYGGYKLGANSANILVQDRITGQINEERMSVYVRLGIRLLYKALGSREMEKKRIRKLLKSLSVKQGKKYDDPASASQIEGFVAFHGLDMSEVLQPMSEFKNFNEFFYRALKPDARPCSAPDRPEIIVSPADCRSVVFNTIDDATRIWVKGRDYSLERLFGDAYPLEAKRYKGGSMGIFRLAPQDYHRFHIPVDGTLGTPKSIEGEYYTVNPMAIRSALDVYGENVRVLVPIDTVAHGRMMFICIGAMMVGSTVITRKAGEKVKRAEELGYFKFGGSTVLLFFEPGKMVYDSDLVDNSNTALETLVSCDKPVLCNILILR